jgi:hypothetical protein
LSWKAETSYQSNNTVSKRADLDPGSPPIPYKRSLQEKESTTMVTLDISKLYNMSWRYAIIKNIKDWKIDGRML